VVIVIAAVAAILPASRDEAAWCWADSHDHAADFKKYMDAWPTGRHIGEARTKYGQRQWVEDKMAMIRAAYAEAGNSNSAAEAQYEKEKRMRRDFFFWKEATNVNTMDSYRNYLRLFPNGRFASEARAHLSALDSGPK
jgi:hypothetical protein